MTRLAAEGQTLPLDDYAEFSPIARRVAEHEHRDRIVALLLREVLPGAAGGAGRRRPPAAAPAAARRRWRFRRRRRSRRP